jgi:MHS family proline/betaine transporter-like MFS transporter
LSDFFPIHVRYSGVSIAWGVSMAIFGGTAPLVANYLQHLLNLSFAPVFYILLSAGVALLVLQNEKRYKIAPIKLELR